MPSDKDINLFVPSLAKVLISAYKTPSVLFTLGLELLQVSAALVIVVPAVGMYDVANACCSNCGLLNTKSKVALQHSASHSEYAVLNYKIHTIQHRSTKKCINRFLVKFSVLYFRDF